MVVVGMRTSSLRQRLVAAACGAVLLAAACSGAHDADGTYVVEFPSASALLSTESIDVDVFDASSEAASCITLSERVRTDQELPAPVARLARVDPCALSRGAGTLRLAGGDRAILIRAN